MTLAADGAGPMPGQKSRCTGEPQNLHAQVRVRGAPKPGARGPDEEAKAKRRLRKLLPSAWARLGVGGDWDASAATAPGGYLKLLDLASRVGQTEFASDC